MLGTFSVPLDIVGSAAFRALMTFDSYVSQLSPKKRHLNVINFVNIDKSVTESLVAIFKIYLSDNGQRLPADTSVRPPSSDTNSTSDDDSYCDSKTSTLSSPRNHCCVCGRAERSRTKFTARTSCPHRCCLNCRSQPCNKCHSLAPAVANSRRTGEVHTSQRDVDSRTWSTGGASAVYVGTNDKTPSRTPMHQLNSHPGHASRSSSRNTVTATGSSKTEPDYSNKSGNSDQAEDKFTHGHPRRRSASLTRYDRHRYAGKEDAENCVICMDKMTNPKKLDCGHVFCADCIEEAFAHTAKCPCCGQIFGKLKGNQPTGGTMKEHKSRDDLAGYRGVGSIVIEYEIPSGFQQVSCDFYFSIMC